MTVLLLVGEIVARLTGSCAGFAAAFGLWALARLFSIFLGRTFGRVEVESDNFYKGSSEATILAGRVRPVGRGRGRKFLNLDWVVSIDLFGASRF